jgi:hypothetical protein
MTTHNDAMPYGIWSLAVTLWLRFQFFSRVTHHHSNPSSESVATMTDGIKLILRNRLHANQELAGRYLKHNPTESTKKFGAL